VEELKKKVADKLLVATEESSLKAKLQKLEVERQEGAAELIMFRIEQQMLVKEKEEALRLVRSSIFTFT